MKKSMDKLMEKFNLAIKNKDVATLTQIVYSNKLDLNMPINEEGDTLLVWSIRNNFWDLIKPLLLNDEIDINKTNMKNESALYGMVYNVIESNIDIEDKKKYTDVIQSVLYRKSLNVNSATLTINGDEKTPWMMVYDARGQKSSEVNELIEKLTQSFAKKEGLRDQFGINEIMYACQKGDEDLVNRILRYGYYDINAQDEFGYTALHHAIMGGNENIVNTILKINEIDINIVNKNNEDAFLLNCLFLRNSNNTARKNIAKTLLNFENININTINKHGDFALHAVYNKKDLTLFNTLLSRFDLDLSQENEVLTEFVRNLLNKGDYVTFNKVIKLKNINKTCVDRAISDVVKKSIKENNNEALDYIMSNSEIKLNKNDDFLSLALETSNTGAINKIINLKEFDVNKPVKYKYIDSAMSNGNIEALSQIVRHQSFDPSIVDQNGANAIGHMFKLESKNLDSDIFGAGCSYILDQISINDIEEILNHVDNNGNDALMSAIVNKVSSNHVEVFLAAIKKHYGYVEIDTTKKNKDGKTLGDLVKEALSHKEEVEVNRLVKIFKDYKNANVLKDAKEKMQTIELEPIIIEDKEI